MKTFIMIKFRSGMEKLIPAKHIAGNYYVTKNTDKEYELQYKKKDGYCYRIHASSYWTLSGLKREIPKLNAMFPDLELSMEYKGLQISDYMNNHFITDCNYTDKDLITYCRTAFNIETYFSNKAV